MIIYEGLVWILVGVATAVLYLTFQQWSVNRLSPNHRKRGMRLVIGGAILRWIFVFFALGLSLSHSFQALIIVFFTFMFVRFIFLLKWQGWLQVKNPFIRQP
jgi:hypothetical protein